MPGHFKFNDYTSAELAAAGSELVAAMRNAYDRKNEPSTEVWTEFILDWFSHAAGTVPNRAVLVDARASDVRMDWRSYFPKLSDIPRRSARAEFLLDLTHSTYPDYTGRYYTDKYWDECILKEREILLGLESEWGRYKNVLNTRVKVLEEAVKLAAVRARTKVLVFGSNSAEQCNRLIADVALLRHHVRDAAPWLLVDVPWQLESGVWNSTSHLLDGTARPADPRLAPA